MITCLSLSYYYIIGIAILTVKCAWTNSPDGEIGVMRLCIILSRDLVCNRSLTCDGRNTETNTNFFYYNNSCQLVPSNCHFSTDINTSSYLFEICIAVCSNATGKLSICPGVWVCVLLKCTKQIEYNNMPQLTSTWTPIY